MTFPERNHPALACANKGPAAEEPPESGERVSSFQTYVFKGPQSPLSRSKITILHDFWRFWRFLSGSWIDDSFNHFFIAPWLKNPLMIMAYRSVHYLWGKQNIFDKPLCRYSSWSCMPLRGGYVLNLDLQNHEWNSACCTTVGALVPAELWVPTQPRPVRQHLQRDSSSPPLGRSWTHPDVA